MTSAGRPARDAAPPDEARFTWRMPTRPLLLEFVRQAAWVTCLWLVVYGGANWITGLHHYRVRLSIESELSIPFVPAESVAYLSLFPLLWLAPWILHTPERLRSFAKSLTWLIVVSGVGFLLFPSERAPPPTPTGVFGKLYAVADWFNLSYNYLPSLHVGMAVVCACAYSRAASPAWAAVFWLWASAIALSTLFIHQHFAIDVVTGALLGWFVVAFHR